ncbi:MAG: sigma-54-dependent Fis family transcriptional regulator [Thalassolituus sp.]|jgi:two-component system response regulator PilR (NtrC family)|uniref:sigma-54-dependent transcriptional regulator n=1 Tax=Thalassolituus sp. TaxID=2030822 RepID=UPI0035174701|nr:MAG: sigma-54-dependent Fis family transcriptional regulator [Thalassolituus sp.]
MAPELSALIVDDEADIRELVTMTLERMGLKCTGAANVREAMEALEDTTFHFCITDMKMPDGDGIQLIHHCARQYPDMPLAMITAFGNMETGVAALKAGAFDVVAKPIDTNRLRDLATAALRLSRVPGVLPPQCLNILSGGSATMSRLRADLHKIARTQAPVVIRGPAGSGKEDFAQAIHLLGSRHDAPFIFINCASVGVDEIEQEIFGSNSHTGAVTEANGGTLFINAIEHLNHDLQGRILRLIQERRFRRPGYLSDDDSDVRIIAGTTADPETLVANGSLRQDLYYRLNVVSLAVPALANRPEDLPTIVQSYLHTYALAWDMPDVSMSSEALALLTSHPFPGNVRELENVLQRAFTMMEGEVIQASDLQLTSLPPTTPDLPPGGTVSDLEGYLERLERQAIEGALQATRWNKTAAAEKLGISFRALRYRCKKLGID